MKKIETIKHFALIEEFETSYKLIKMGFGELQNINLNNDFYFLPFQLLSQGFERLMKAYICIGYFEKEGTLPDFRYLKKIGHDLEKLLHEILENYFVDFNRSQFNTDKEFITGNLDLKELLYILSEFGKLSRYYNFDIITGNARIGIDTKDLWEKYENKILKTNKHVFDKLMDFDKSHEVYEKISSHIIITFEKFISGLSRQFIFNCLGDTAQQLTVSNYFSFGVMYEKDYGVTDYRKNTTKYKQTLKRSHKRSIKDYFNRKYNSNFKSKKIIKSDYIGEWPFYADEVIIECRYKYWSIVTIDGYDYALNGSASGKYKLQSPNEAGMSIIGKPVTDFIKLSQDI